MKKVFFVLFVFCILSTAANVHAFRCNNEPIGWQDSTAKVLEYCGKPFAQSHRRVYYKNSYVHAPTWYYNCGEGDFIYELTIADGIVIMADSIKRGSGVSKCGQY